MTLTIMINRHDDLYLIVIIEFRQEEMLKLKMLQATPQFSTQPTGVVEFRC